MSFAFEPPVSSGSASTINAPFGLLWLLALGPALTATQRLRRRT